jgi:hypothetical protein
MKTRSSAEHTARQGESPENDIIVLSLTSPGTRREVRRASTNGAQRKLYRLSVSRRQRERIVARLFFKAF